MNETYNIYCDESRVENIESKKMTIGALFIPRRKKKKIIRDIKAMFKDFNFAHELKWSKTGDKYFDLYKNIIDYFTESKNMQFRIIIVDKSKVAYEKYHNNDKELAFFKFYYLMLKPRLFDNSSYYIYLDKKPTRDKNIARALHSFLDSYILLRKNNCGIKHFQAYSSDQNILIQIADFFTGLFGYACNEDIDKHALKSKLIKYFMDKAKIKNLCASTPLNEDKCNIFVWKGKDL